jgi:hypothetical protein
VSPDHGFQPATESTLSELTVLVSYYYANVKRAWILYVCLDWYGLLEQGKGLVTGDKDWLILYIIIFIFILSSAWLSEGLCCGGQGSPP